MSSYFTSVSTCEIVCDRMTREIHTQANKIAKLRSFKNFEEMRKYYMTNGIKDEFCIGVLEALGGIGKIYENCGQ